MDVSQKIFFQEISMPCGFFPGYFQDQRLLAIESLFRAQFRSFLSFSLFVLQIDELRDFPASFCFLSVEAYYPFR